MPDRHRPTELIPLFSAYVNESDESKMSLIDDDIIDSSPLQVRLLRIEKHLPQSS